MGILIDLRPFPLSNPGMVNERPFFRRDGQPGAGKTSLIQELARRGCHTLPESGRAIIREEIQSGGGALPWADRMAYTEQMLERDLRTYNAAQGPSAGRTRHQDDARRLSSAAALSDQGAEARKAVRTMVWRLRVTPVESRDHFSWRSQICFRGTTPMRSE
ncbi:AAA family ATPase [Leisingera sp. F5]|uniref:AAA family ATPase n=1 Tax=Leisingera sp. F5 TaxID=1813816 RepID=UPI0025BD82B7|nr:AAA family ATPase [Leisingera sp. F5]